MNIMMLLEMASATFPERVAFVDGHDGSRLTYQQLFDSAKRHAQELVTGGYARVGMLDVSSLATPVGLFSASWAGVPYVPINYRLTAAEIEALLRRITPACLVCENQREQAFAHVPDVTAIARNDFLADLSNDLSGDSQETS